MATEQHASVNIPKDLLEPIIKSHLDNALKEAMGPSEQILKIAVQRVLESKVDSNGQITTNSYSQTGTFLNYLIIATFKTVAQDVMKECVTEYREEIKAECIKQLKRDKSRIAQALAENMAVGFERMADQYNLKVNLSFDDGKPK